MNRIYLVAVSVSVILISIFIVFSAIQILDPHSEKFNVVVIMADDLDTESVNLLLETDLMPNFKKHLVEDGTTFSNSFVTTSDCCPSRATFFSGQYAHNHGVLTNRDIREFNDKSTLSTWLHESGYRTGFVGKYLNGIGTNLPATYVPQGWDFWQALVEKKVEGVPYKYSMYNYSISNNGILLEYGDDESDYQTEVIGQLSSKFIEESTKLDKTKPFFLVISPFAPHADQNAQECILNTGSIRIAQGPERISGIAHDFKLQKKPSFNETDISDKPSWLQKISPLTSEHYRCLEMVHQNRIEATIGLDNLVDTVFEKLAETNQLSKTMIIFTSDNGYILGEHRLAKKHYPYEESIRVPLFIKIPGFQTKSSDKLVINTDLAPTILEFTNTIPKIEMDGKSLLPLLKNQNNEKWRDQFLIEYWGAGIVPSFSAIRNTSHIYIEYPNSSEFYNIIDDPYQLNNQYLNFEEKNKKIFNELKNQLSLLRDCMGKRCHELEGRQ